MLKLLGGLISFFLMALILFRIPDEDVGLRSFSSRSDVLGSPSSARRFLDILTGVCILIYLAIAFQLNLSKN